MGRTDNRLDLDADLVGYWGFDEALETDNALDESQYADAHLTVSNATGVKIGRVGGAREFGGDGQATVSNARLRLSGNLTLICWAKMTTVNAAGSQLRAVVSCSGPTMSDAELYGLYVDYQGRLVYKHTAASGEVVIRTAPGTIKVGQLYNYTILRSAGGTQVQLIVDNFPVIPADITVGGTPSTFPVPPPVSNSSAIFAVARSQSESDLAPWDGLIDEMSLHQVVRDYRFYRGPYYLGIALRNNHNHLSSPNTVTAVTSSDMGRGVRWWCYVRDRDLFVVKESPFGKFGPETRLTTSGSSLFTGVESPELIYDAAADILYVFFVAGNRIFKLTATSTDDPATINMPFTADTGNIIKAVDFNDPLRLGEGGGQKDPLPQDVSYLNRQPVKLLLSDAVELSEGAGQSFAQPPSPYIPSIAFIQLPAPQGFGIVMNAAESRVSGYAVYEITGGVAIQLPNPVRLSEDTGRYFSGISNRKYGRKFIVESLLLDGSPSGAFSPALVDTFLEMTPSADGLRFNLAGYTDETIETSVLGEGGSNRPVNPAEITYLNRTPIKLSIYEEQFQGEGSGQQGSITRGSTTVIL